MLLPKQVIYYRLLLKYFIHMILPEQVITARNEVGAR